MATITLENTGVDHLYPDGMEIFESVVSIPDLIKVIARLSSLAVLADPFFNNSTPAQRLFSELHGEGDRITEDFISQAVRDITPVFASKQKFIQVDGTYPTYEYTQGVSVTINWENHDTRTSESKMDYSPLTKEDIRIDTAVKTKVDNYLFEAFRDYVLRELYKAVGHTDKYVVYRRAYEQNRQQVAYWVKNDTSMQTQYQYAGV